MIPKTLHIIWVGDDRKRPDNCIRTWVERNPGWTVTLWGNDDLANYGWYNARHMREMAPLELNGVADLMRWEILYNEGGFVVDADSSCTRPLDDWLLESEAFAWFARAARAGHDAVPATGGQPAGEELEDGRRLDLFKPLQRAAPPRDCRREVDDA